MSNIAVLLKLLKLCFYHVNKAAADEQKLAYKQLFRIKRCWKIYGGCYIQMQGQPFGLHF